MPKNGQLHNVIHRYFWCLILCVWLLAMFLLGGFYWYIIFLDAQKISDHYEYMNDRYNGV